VRKLSKETLNSRGTMFNRSRRRPAPRRVTSRMQHEWTPAKPEKYSNALWLVHVLSILRRSTALRGRKTSWSVGTMLANSLEKCGRPAEYDRTTIRHGRPGPQCPTDRPYLPSLASQGKALVKLDARGVR